MESNYQDISKDINSIYDYYFYHNDKEINQLDKNNKQEEKK